MNNVKLTGRLTKAPFFADKGWVGCTLAVDQEGTDFKLWVPLFVPKTWAAQFQNLSGDEVFTIEGMLDAKKDKTLQVKVLTAAKANASPVFQGPSF